MIGPLGGFAIVAGSMLGIGIFLSPPIVAQTVAEPLPFLLVWAAGGVTALAGAVACGELGAMFPRAGGDYVFQYEAYGRSVAFASGWTLFAAIFCGSIAAMSVGLCTYQLPALLGVDLAAFAVPLPGGAVLDGTRLAAIALVVGLTLLNVRGARPAAGTQAALTLVPIAALALFSLWALLRGGAPPPAGSPAPPPRTSFWTPAAAASSLRLCAAASAATRASSSSFARSTLPALRRPRSPRPRRRSRWEDWSSRTTPSTSPIRAGST